MNTPAPFVFHPLADATSLVARLSSDEFDEPNPAIRFAYEAVEVAPGVGVVKVVDADGLLVGFL